MNDTQAIILLDLVRKAKIANLSTINSWNLYLDTKGISEINIQNQVENTLTEIERYIFQQWKLHRGEQKEQN